MIQPWIHKKQTDVVFILLPPFFIALIVLLFNEKLAVIQDNYSFLTWVVFIVFIDVAHVYASLFKTYLNKTEISKHKRLFTVVPAICLLLSIAAFIVSKEFFWSVLAYIAVFHFIRQQYGFMRLYSRNEPKNRFKLLFDKIVIYNATVFPMLFWFLNPDRNFNWFVSNEFLQTNQPQITNILFICFVIIFTTYLVSVVYGFIKTKKLNLPKNLLILGTYISWYLGIVHYNNELIFTAFNVVSHGIPYMALVYFKEIKPNKKGNFYLSFFQTKYLLIVFILILLGLAFLEELIWELTVWEEHFQFTEFYISDNLHFIWIPILTLPQLTHYVLDGFIWKSKK
ncbi:MAG: hypothetical protein RSF68_02070 [Myroides sp.]